MGYLGKDTELRQAIDQQGQVIHQVWEQSDANAAGQLNKQEAFMVVLAIMAVMLIFRR